MSLSALRIIADISDPQKANLLRSFFSQQPAAQGISFLGDINAVEFYPVVANASGSTPFWLPADLDPTKLKLAIGDPGAVSTGGTVSLNYDGDPTGLTATAISVSESVLQAALNANPAVIATGQTYTVTELSDCTYKLAWSGVGAKELVQGDASNATPESVVVADWLVEGDGTTKAVQLLRFLARPYVFVDSWTELDGATPTVTELRTGSGADKAMFAVSIAPTPYQGSFYIKDSGALAVNGAQSDWQTAMGSGWTVLKTGDASLTIERTTAAAYTLVAADVDVSGLSVYNGYRGILSFNKTALFERFAGITDPSFSTSMQIRHDDTEVDTLNFSAVTLHNSLLSSGALSPSNWNNGYYTKTEVDALIAAAISAALTPEAIIALVLAADSESVYPTSDPGDGKQWSNGGVLQVGP